MYELAYYALIGFVLSLLFLNLYFRVKVMKLYNYLVKNKVQFDASHMLNKEKLKQEVLPRYPQYETQIMEFVTKVRFSITIACLLFMLITFVGLLLKHYS